MGALHTKLNDDLKTAMKAGKKDEVGTLRMAISDCKYKRIEKSTEDLSDQDVIEVLSAMKKKRIEAAEAYEKAARADLAAKEREEITVIERYLPAQLSEAEISALVEKAVQSTGASSPKDMGKVMGALMPHVKGRADGGLVSSLVKKKLGG